jgi:hypothetical protein
MRLELAKVTLIGILHRWAPLLRHVMVTSLLLQRRKELYRFLSSPLQRHNKLSRVHCWNYRGIKNLYRIFIFIYHRWIFIKIRTAPWYTQWPGVNWFMKKTWSLKSSVTIPLRKEVKADEREKKLEEKRRGQSQRVSEDVQALKEPITELLCWNRRWIDSPG